MPFQDKIRSTIYNLVGEALREKLYFKAVKLQMPDADPTQFDSPSAFLALLPETMEGITNKERLSSFRIAVILLVRAEKDVDLCKLEALDVAERAINNLQTDARYTSVGSLIHIQTVDPGPLALAVYGLDWQILPPFGVVRLDVLAEFIYQAID